MKKLITLFAFIFLTFVSNAQIKVFETTAIAFKTTTEWTDWQPYITIIISNSTEMYVDIDNLRFKISSEKSPIIVTETNKNSLILFCYDINNIKCVIEFVDYTEPKNIQVYIRYSEKEIVYQIKL